ncbi:MAG: DUF1553 domain-containing protein, partial [Planctomycetaceae bacterium]|nr:DUF1553 domain-containing protein [Planctomycetaceae bacterium]
PDSGRRLTADEKQTLVEWVRAGAPWQQHWAFLKPVRPDLPAVKDTAWPRNAIDFFVLSKLESLGLTPAPEATREKWLRRVTFDLTGLPPTLKELDAFLADDSPSAYESVVDRLLASPRYGEHLAATWLDAARYADTDGYQNDGPREMWRWRDWVIDAYNANMPFDQFTIEQLAGDQLPNATLSQLIATGFNRNHRYNSEAGLVLEEFLLENAVDRVDTTGTVWMGLTMGCARCHDHKYDPFTQQEYYQLISFFDNVAESGRAIKFGNSEPWVIAPTPQQQTQLEALDSELLQAQQAVDVARTNYAAAENQLHATLIAAADSAAFQQSPVVIRDGLIHAFHFEDMDAEGITVEKGQPVLREAGSPGTEAHAGNAATVGGKGILALGKVGNVECHTRSTVAFWMKAQNTTTGVVISRQSGGTTRPGFTVELRDGHLQFFIIGRWIDAVSAVETLTTIPADEWIHVALTNDGTQRDVGMQIRINGQLCETRSLYNTNSNTGGTGKDAVLRIGGGVVGDLFAGQVDDLLFYDRTLFPDEIAALAETHTVPEILRTQRADRTAAMTARLDAFIKLMMTDSEQSPRAAQDGGASDQGAAENTSDGHGGREELVALATALGRFSELQQKRIRLLDTFPTTMVMRDWSTPRKTFVRLRGVYDQPGEEVQSGIPAIFSDTPHQGPMTRLEFARSLVDGRHPLTARVTVNRDWQRCFGTGLVRTAEDFGLQGEQPSHPGLLDWLAVEFVESGWNVKALQKLIVLSATYRQSSVVRQLVAADGQIREDPDNRLLSRGPRLRLSARQLRDQSLAVSGLMDPEIGGPSVSPYQPEGLWEEMSNMTYRQSKGKDLYRRGLYTLWKRTVAPPGLAILDAADRENCVVRPKRTNTPLQALTLLNETTFIESARHLAARLLRDSPDDVVTTGFRTLTSRDPTEREHRALSVSLLKYRKAFQQSPEQAEKLLSVGDSPGTELQDHDRTELAAVTVLCNVLMNLDESLNRE